MRKILDFPFLRQSTRHTCSCCALQGCLCYFGIEKREDQLARLMGVTRNTQEVRPEKIQKVAELFGIKTEYKRLRYVHNLIEHIKNRQPVIVSFQAWSTAEHPDYTKDNNGHYATVIGFDTKKEILIFADSSCYNRVYLPYKEFELRWHDGNVDDLDYWNMGIIFDGKPVYKSKRIEKMQ